MMRRRTFTGLMAMAPAGGNAPTVEAALLTHKDGPHLGAYLEGLAKTAVVGTVHLCDPEGTVTAAAGKQLGMRLGKIYRQPETLFAAHRPQLALVTMEARLAPPAIAAALAAGCHVLAEKPACVRAEDFAPLAAQAAGGKRHLMLALANRLDPVMREARRLVQAGSIGRLYGMELHTIADQTRLTRPEYQRSWFASKERAGGGHLIWLGIHWLDLAMYLSGSAITQVAGFTGNAGGEPIDTEDAAVLSFRFENGMLGNLTSAYYLDGGKQLFLKFWGAEGWMEIHHGTDHPLQWYSNRDRKLRQYTPPATAPLYTAMVTHAARAAAGLEPPVMSPAESLRVLRTVFAAYRAAGSGQTQRVG